ncbi:MAG: hypothetical protein ACR2NX_06925, partial [Chthoniobacterales bacterium]
MVVLLRILRAILPRDISQERRPPKPVKDFRRSVENRFTTWRTPEKGPVGAVPFQKKPGRRPFVSPGLWSRCAEAGATRKTQITSIMNNAQLKELVTSAVTLHREIAAQNERLKKF